MRSVPIITMGEAAIAIATAVVVGPHDPVAFATIEALIFAWNRTRRSEAVRDLVVAQAGVARKLLAYLPVPPVTHDEEPRQLPAPKMVPQIEEITHQDQKYPEVETPSKGFDFTAFLSLVNDDPDEAPHLFIAGTSGAGKTILAQAIAASRNGFVVILDPKRPQGWKAPKWGGLPYISRDQNGTLAPMVTALKQVVKEMERRYKAQESAKEPFPTITLIIDEGRNVVEEAPEVAVYYKRIISIGREVGVRLILISTTDRAGKLGFAGEADSLQSLTPVRLGHFAVPFIGKSPYSGGRPYTQAVIFARGQWVPFDNRTTLAYVEAHTMKPACVWLGVQPNCQFQNELIAESSFSISESGFLSNLLAEELPNAAEGRKDVVETEVSSVSSKKALPSFLPSFSAVAGITEPSAPEKEEQTFSGEVLRKAQKALQIAKAEGISKSKAISRVTNQSGGSYWATVAAAYDVLKEEV